MIVCYENSIFLTLNASNYEKIFGITFNFLKFSGDSILKREIKFFKFLRQFSIFQCFSNYEITSF